MDKLIKLFASISLCLFVGFLGSSAMSQASSNWYATLNKPTFTPPDSVFGLVWITLYILMGISFFLVWTKNTSKKKIKREGIRLFFIQLILNGLWTFIFFALKMPTLALAELVVLWAILFITIRTFKQISKPAAYLLYPYLAWITLAAILNVSILMLNKFD